VGQPHEWLDEPAEWLSTPSGVRYDEAITQQPDSVEPDSVEVKAELPGCAFCGRPAVIRLIWNTPHFPDDDVCIPHAEFALRQDVDGRILTIAW
jgi:hypothetical protein